MVNESFLTRSSGIFYTLMSRCKMLLSPDFKGREVVSFPPSFPPLCLNAGNSDFPKFLLTLWKEGKPRYSIPNPMFFQYNFKCCAVFKIM